MPRKSQKTTRETATGATQVPEFMRADAGKGLEGVKPEDLTWVGEKFLVGDADRERDARFDAIAQEIFNPRYALRLILGEVIRSHPIKGQKRNDKTRLEAALTELLGRDTRTPAKSQNTAAEPSEKHKGGRKELMDEDLLRVIAREYLRDAYGFSSKPRTMKELCWEALREKMPNWRELNEKELDSLRHRLSRKFSRGEARDRIMIEYTRSTDYNERRFIELTEKVLAYLAALGLVDRRITPADKSKAIKSTKA